MIKQVNETDHNNRLRKNYIGLVILITCYGISRKAFLLQTALK